MDQDHLHLLAGIASMYYQTGLSQKKIAGRTGYSRSMISRLLAEARSKGIVEIRIRQPHRRLAALEAELEARCGLQSARVLAAPAAGEGQPTLPGVGFLAAQYLDEVVRDGMTIGVSWGTTLLETVNALRPKPFLKISIVQLIGLSGARGPHLDQIDAGDLCRRMARALGGQAVILPAPFIVDSEDIRRAIVSDRGVTNVLTRTAEMALALVGVGAVQAPASTLLSTGLLSPEHAACLAEQGAIGDVCGIFFDRAGQLVDIPLARRVVGVGAARLRAIPLRLGVAAGLDKAWPIVGAIRAGLINALVTDETTALEMVRVTGI